MPHPIMAVLHCGVPLTLLMDLRHPDGPNSQDIYLLEQPLASGSHPGIGQNWGATRLPDPRRQP